MTDEGYEELKKLQKEYIDDVSLNIANLSDKVMLTPTIKAKWVGHYYEYKHEIDILEKAISKLREKEQRLIANNIKVGVSAKELESLKLKNNENLYKVEERLSDVKVIASALREYQKLVAFYGNDVKNALDYLKLD